jgi:hypothetical protein
MAKPARLQILERARALIEDEGHWCPGDLARDAWGFSISPIDRDAEQRCALGALLAAAYELTGDFDQAQKVATGAMRPDIGATSLTHINDVEGHAAILKLFDRAIAAQ